MNKTQRIYKNNFIKNSMSLSPGAQLNPYKSVLKPNSRGSAQLSNKSPMSKLQNKINFNEQLEDIKEDQIREQQITERDVAYNQNGQKLDQNIVVAQGTVPAATRIQQPEVNTDLQRIEEKIDMLMEQQIYNRNNVQKMHHQNQLMYPSRRSQRDWKKTGQMNKTGKMARIAGLSLADPIPQNRGDFHRSNNLDYQKRTAKNNKSQNISSFLMNEIPQFLKAEEQSQARVNSRGEKLKKIHEKHISGRLKTAGYEEGHQNIGSLTGAQSRSQSRHNAKGNLPSDSKVGLPKPGAQNVHSVDLTKSQHSRGGRRAKQIESIEWNMNDQPSVDPRLAIKSTEPRLRNGKLRVNDNKDLQSIGEYLKNQSHTSTKNRSNFERPEFTTTSASQQTQSNYDTKIKNLKKMYNLSVKNDYQIYESGIKTSIRNKKSRASHDANFLTQNESAKQGGKHVFSFEKATSNETKKEHDNTISEKNANPQVSRSLRISQPIESGTAHISQGNHHLYHGGNAKKYVQKSENLQIDAQFSQTGQLMPLSEINMRPPMSVSSQERPLEAILPNYDKRRMRAERKEQISSNQKSRVGMGNKTRNQITLYSEKNPSKSGKIPLEPLKKTTTSKTRNDAMMIENNHMIENVSDYEYNENKKSLVTDLDHKKKAVSNLQTPQYKQNFGRARNNQSPIGQTQNRAGYPSFSAFSAGNTTKNTAQKVTYQNNKYETAAARYKAQAEDVGQHGSNFIIKTNKNNKNIQHKSSEQFLLAESKDQTHKSSAQVSKMSSENQLKEQEGTKQQNKYKNSPYTQVLNANSTHGSGNGFGVPHQSMNKRQLAQRQQRAMVPPTVQTSDTLAQIRDGNQLKVQKAYKNAVGVIPNPERANNQMKKQKQLNRQKKEQAVKSAIDKINLKIDGLKDNLNCYEKNIDLTLKEIPKDIRSMNNSNFNNSSSRYQNQETDRNSKLLKTNRQLDGGMVIPDDLSEETLKTILDFHSDRAQTQQRNRDMNQRQSQSHMSQIGSQMPQNLPTSRLGESRQGFPNQIQANFANEPQNLSGYVEAIVGDIPKVASITHDERKNMNQTQNESNFDMGPVPESIHKSFNLQSVSNGRKGLNLTNMTNILQNGTGEEYHGQEEKQNNSAMMYKQKTERLQKTSFTNLQAYFQQRGINNNTNLSAALSINNSNYGIGDVAVQNPERNAQIGILVANTNLSALGSSNQEIKSFEASATRNHIPGVQIPALSINNQVTAPPETPQPMKIHQNFYPQHQAQSRLSQKSAIFDITASHPLSHRNQPQNAKFEQD